MSNTDTTWKPELYNSKHSFVYAYGESLVELLDPKPHERILDLGCGSGQLTAKINERAQKTIGIDKSAKMIADARSKFPEIEFKVGNASDFSFENRFNSIFSNATLHWVKEYNAAIRCMYNNLLTGGKIVVEFGGQGNVETIVNQLRIALRDRNYLVQSELELWYFPTIGEYTTALESAGFKVILAEHFDRPTRLADEKSGIKDWISMFAEGFLAGVLPGHIEEIKAEVQDRVKDRCLIEGNWYADYKRIRVIAKK